MTDKIQFVKNNMLDLIPIAKKIKENEIEEELKEENLIDKQIKNLNKKIKVDMEKWI